jgi:predicted enzyme related to lactoylglutathione lyase
VGESRHPAGSVCWLDLGIADVDAAVAFYGELLGWTVAPPDGTGYRLAGLPGGLVAAFGPAEDPGAPYWTVYVGTADIEASVRAYAAAGGTVVAPPEAVGDVGASAVVRDPAGVPMSFWQPGTHLGTYAAGSGEPGTLAGVRLLAADPARTGAFLAAALGWHLQPDGTITHADTPRRDLVTPTVRGPGRAAQLARRVRGSRCHRRNRASPRPGRTTNRSGRPAGRRGRAHARRPVRRPLRPDTSPLTPEPATDRPRPPSLRD